MELTNKKANFEYEFLDTYEVGIALTGTEIKSVRNSKLSLGEAFCKIENDELFIYNLHISKYLEGTYNNHEEKRVRKLLLKKNIIKKWAKELKVSNSLTIIPNKIFINKKGWCKLFVSLSRGKKIHDKRESIKEKDIKRQQARNSD